MKNVIENHIEVLGFRAVDKVTGLEGVITCVSFDLYGCIQAALQPEIDQKGNIADCQWYDVTRLTFTSKRRVMDLPDFYEGYVAEGKKGPAEKPLINN